MTEPDQIFDPHSYLINLQAAYEANLFLYDAESECKTALYGKFKVYVTVWEYGYYFLSLAIKHTNLDRSYGIIAAYFSEAMTSLRPAFLDNLNGYQSESINTLRRVHDAAVRALALRHKPQRLMRIVQSSSLQSFHNQLGLLFLNDIYNVPSSFTHGNKLKVIETLRKANSKELSSIEYGCQINEEMFSYSAQVSIFWLYFLSRIVPILFEKQVNSY
ncbi:MAG: hypothetical protein UX04_C0006G0050 [Microgenomates group bacterium GW2011_GWF2_45_18]|nr:MAG: hypothetical protein UW18_C0006G0050 [Microgenomates group bacterium GW2011_GWF1_44_10]KKU01515.1 MAG: hypothetical protein UX04_C0006G0050 [Microgenomates group bacterium GW2011_GWF2_45_18]OGJ41436.1 MAG: hypothetical protein A2378_00245 [Candidatus Pacebacteria bacterium RIFOXYB1_FULL_44_10]HAU99422.1 hypothetical protein [Candidatus Paceibacterota bacterium]HAX01572.1 hypothetical protein [Candidatus Paceibacterota bacterium]